MADADVVIKCEEFMDNEIRPEDGNNTYFNIYESRDENEPENDENRIDDDDYENDDMKLQELLREFDLEILFTILKFGDITYRSLKYISENDINAAIRSIAYRAEFREKLFAWRRDKYGLNDFSVLPPPKTTSSLMPLGVNNSNNILSHNTNTYNTNAPSRVIPSPYDHMKTTTTTSTTTAATPNTRQQPPGLAPRTRRLSTPKTNSAKKPRTTNQTNQTQERQQKRTTHSPQPPPSPTPTASQSMTSPTPTLSDTMSLLQQDSSRIDSQPSMDYDDPLCYQPTTSSAAAAATQPTGSMKSEASAPPYAQPKMAFEKLIMPNKGQTRKWNPEGMRKAILEVRNGAMGILLASKTFEVPFATLQRAARSDKPISEILATPLGRKPVFTRKMESELVKYIKEMESRFWGLTRNDICSLAFQVAKRNNIVNPFSVLKECAGKYWLNAFLRRHKLDISIRNRTETSMDTAKGFNAENVGKFYSLLKLEYEKYKFSPTRIWNVDETAVSIVQSKQPRILAAKGNRQIGVMTSAERDSLITVVSCMSAGGDFVPPYFIFPRKNHSPLLMKHAPPGSDSSCHISGWIQIPIFSKWFDHFLRFTNPSVENPILLILDGHFSHTRNIEVLEKARENYVIIISLPPHCTHKLQPLDRAFMGPLKTCYSDEISRFMREQGRKVTQFDVIELFSKAYLKAQTPQIAINGFKCTGIYPFDKNIFQNSDFLHELAKNYSEEAIRYKIEENVFEEPVASASDEAINNFFSHEEPERPEKQISTCDSNISLHHLPSSDEDSWTEIQPNNDTVCDFCNKSFQMDKKNKTWVQCLQCDIVWAHNQCLPKRQAIFVCESCKSL